MAEIMPFKGVYYNTDRVELDRVVGPPYDVLNADQQAALYAESPYNFVRIMLNQAEAGDGSGSNPYMRAAGFLNDWLASGVLMEDAAPALYLYRQEFTNPADGRRYTRSGLFCALKLEPYSAGVVLPHEETRTKAKEDRLNLMRATSANPEPIFGLYEDEQGELDTLYDRIAAGTPFLEVHSGGDTHRVWRVDDRAAIERAQTFLSTRRVWIADGHHRYETGLAYGDEHRAQEPGSDPRPYDYLLIVLTSFTDPGIVVLPTHRLVKNVPGSRIAELYLQLERYFDIEPVHPDKLAERMQGNPAEGVHRFGLLMRDKAWVLTLRDPSIMDSAVEGHADCWKQLDVSILQALVLERSLGIPATTLATTPDIGYTRDLDEAFERVSSGEYQIALLLNLPSAEEVRYVAAAGDKMPPKSTFFYPKLWSGLLMRRV
jgi:uncharacterized protein (DUF1015 family)